MHPQTYKLVLNNPCHEDWNSMSIIESGRHCEQCSKNVIDFSTYSKEAIVDFFVANQGKSICGRMKKSQMNAIEIDRHLLGYNISFWKKFLIIFLIVFGYEFFGASFVFAQVAEKDTALQKLTTNIMDTLKLDSVVTDSTIENKTSFKDSTILLKEERKKLKDEIEKLEMEITDIKLKEASHKFLDFKLEPINCEDIILGGFGLVPNSDLKPFIFGETKSDDSKIEIKLSKNNNIKKNIIPIDSKNKTPKTPIDKDYPIIFVLPNDKQFKIGDEEFET